MILGTVVAQAQTAVYWDTNGATPGSSNTTDRVWQQSTGAYWSVNAAGTASTTTWSSVAPGNKTATFSAGTNATGTNLITVTGTISDVAGLHFEEGNVTLGGSGTLTLSNSNPTFNVNGTANATITANIGQSGWSGFTKTGGGNLTLSGNNTFGAQAFVNAGTLTLASNNALGSSTWGNTVASGATLALTQGITVNEGQFIIEGTGVGGGGAIRNLDGNNTLHSALTLTADATIVTDAGSLTISGQFNDSAGRTLTVAGAGHTTLSGAINTSVGITKTGTGTLTFSGISDNSYTSTLAIKEGTVALAKTPGQNAIGGATVNVGDGIGGAGSAVLRLEANHQIADHAGLITINSDGVFRLNNFTEQVNLIGGTGLIDLGTSGHLTVGVNSGSSTFGGSLTGTGTFEKTGGGGTLTLANDIDFDGTFKLSGGTLALNGHDLIADTLHITANSAIDFGNATASLLSVSNFLIDAGVTLTIRNWSETVDYFYAQNWAGAIFNTSGATPMNQVAFQGFSNNKTYWQDYDRQITPVPEPSTYGAMLIALAGAIVAWRRWRQRRP